MIRKSVKKTDRKDAETLAVFLSKGLLPEVRVKDKLHAELASLTQTRATLVKQRTALKNKINNMMAASLKHTKPQSPLHHGLLLLRPRPAHGLPKMDFAFLLGATKECPQELELQIHGSVFPSNDDDVFDRLERSALGGSYHLNTW